jgi:hypothetical protein
MKTNTPAMMTARTHEGAAVPRVSAMAELRRTASACLLFEDTFYESGVDIATRLRDLVHRVPLDDALHLAQDLRHKNGLRHAPLWMLNAALDHPEAPEFAANRHALSMVIANVCGSRADLPGELLAMYRKDNPRRPLAKALKRGLADAIKSLSSYAIQKYAPRGKGAYRLRDVLFLTRPKPRDNVQAEWFKMLADDTLPQADTWETKLSGGADKRETFEAMLRNNTLGALAILRNLRNMVQVGVPHDLVAKSLMSATRANRFGTLPFQYVAASRAVPSMEPVIEAAMLTGVQRFMSDNATPEMIETNGNLLSGHTILLVDVSGSMRDPLSGKSTLDRSDAAAAMAILLREVCDEVSVFDYNTSVREVPARRGFALRDAFRRPYDGTYTGKAAHAVLHEVTRRLGRSPERIIVITDEQSRDTLPPLPTGTRGYVMNVAPYQNGIAWGRWTTVSGFSENLVKFIIEAENEEA